MYERTYILIKEVVDMSYIKRTRHMTKCPPYAHPTKIKPTKIVLHSTGCAQQKIAPYISAENSPNTNAAVTGFIGEDSDGAICFVQTLPFNYRAWHAGSGSIGSYNNNGPGIEVCEPSGGQTYKGGVISNLNKEKYRGYFNETKQIAIEVFGDFCREFALDPYTAIVDHQEAHRLGYGSNHGDIKHWWDRIYGYTLNDFRKDVSAYMHGNKPGDSTNGIAIMGKAKATATQMKAYIAAHNKDKKWQDIVDIYLEEGKAEGVKGDVAFAQSCLETGYFKFAGDVSEAQNNFAGIGTTGGGVKGRSFPDVRTGVRAQIQHLKAYASKKALNNKCVDPRFDLVTRGIATTVDDLGGKWAADTKYGKKITAIYSDILAIQTNQTDIASKPVDSAAKQYLFKVQVGAFSKVNEAYALESKLLADGFETCIAKADGFYKVQVGAYSVKAKAEKKAAELNAKGYDTFITTANNRPASGSIGYKPTKKLNYKTGKYRVTAKQGLNVRSGPGTEYPILDFKKLTKSAQAQGGYVHNLVFTALDVVNSEKSAWAKTPSGWVCLEINGNKYVKLV